MNEFMLLNLGHLREI